MFLKSFQKLRNRTSPPTNRRRPAGQRAAKSSLHPRIESLEPRLALAVAVWDGGSLDSDHWSEDFNWVGDVAPHTGDDLVFAAAADQFTSVNDFPAGTRFSSITLEASYELSGNAITLQREGGGVDAPPPAYLGATAGSSSIGFDIALPTPPPIAVDIATPTPPPIVPPNPVRVAQGSGLELAGVVSGAADLEKLGAGTLILSAANTFTGRMLVQDGVLSVAHSQALGGNAAGTELFGSALLRLDGQRGSDLPAEDLTVVGETLTIGQDVSIPQPPPIRLASLGGANVWAGPIHTDVVIPTPPPIRILAESSLELAGVIDGDADLEKVGIAPLILSAANTFTGKITVMTGPLSVRDDEALGASDAGTELVIGAALELFSDVGDVIIGSEPLNFIPPTGGGLPGFPPKFHFGSRGGNNFWGGQIHTNKFADSATTFEIVTESPLELAGVIDGGTDLEKFGVAPLILSAENDFTSQMVIGEGTVSVANDLALGSAGTGTELAVGAELELLGGVFIESEPLDFVPPIGGGLPGFPPKFHFGSRGGDNFWGGRIRTNEFAFAGIAPTFELLAASPLELAGIIDGATDLEKRGAAALVLSAANTFTSHLTVAEGTVSLFDDQALGASSSGTEILEGATLELVGGLIIDSEPLDLGQIGGLGTPLPGFPPKFSFGGRGGNNAWTGPVTVWCELCPVSAAASSTLELAGQVSGDADAALQKIGPGTLILSAANTFRGETFVAEGTLSVRHDLALGAATAATELLSGATLELVGGISVVGEALVLTEVAQPTPPPIRLTSLGGANVWAGPIHTDVFSPTPPPIRILAESSLELAGAIDGDADIQKLGASTLVFSGDSPDYTGTIHLLAGTLVVTGSLPNATVELEGGTFVNEGTVGALTVHGTAAADVIRIAPAGRAEAVEVLVNGVSQGSFTLAQRLVVRAGAGDDDVQATGSIGLSVWLFGEAGHDRLKGGADHDVLVGGDGDDLLHGGQGRDLLIGGRGADRLFGNVDDDILIAGFTSFDANDAALAAIMSEWTSARTYEARFANLRGDATHPQFVDRANGNTFLKADGPNATVFDDGAIDKLTGSSGRDWFFAGDEDQIVDLKDDELADDVESF